MKYFLRAIFAVAITSLLVAAPIAPSEAARRSSSSSAFDGSWSVAIYTLRGDCDRSVRAALRIIHGRIVAEDPNLQAAGSVAANGAIRVVVSNGRRSASGSGRLSRNSGGGYWRTSTGECSGQWTAARRGGEW